MAYTLSSEDPPEERDEKLENWREKFDAPDLAVDYLRHETKRAPDSADTRQTRIQNYVVWLNENDIAPEKADHKDISNFLWSLEEEGHAASYVRDHYRVIRHFYKSYLVEWEELLEEPPTEKMTMADFGNGDNKKDKEREQARKYITYDEKELLRENVPSPKLRNELIIELIWQTGIRRKEVVEIRLDDISQDDRKIKIWGKGSKERNVYYKPSLNSLLEKYIKHVRPQYYYADKSDYLFLTRESDKMYKDRPGTVVRKAAENAGILKKLPDYQDGSPTYWPSTHRIRNGHAVHALRSPDITLRDLQGQLGHESLEQTEKYLEMMDEDRKRAYSSFGAHRGD